MLFTSSGILTYNNNNPIKLVLVIEQDIADYYRSFIPKSQQNSRQRYNAHISIVRNETPPKMSYWGIYEGEQIEFSYEPIINEDDRYFWINVKPHERFKQIRLELGLSECRSYTGLYHVTIANKKGK